MKAYKIAVAGTGARAAEYIENIKRLYAPLETVCLYSPDEEEGAMELLNLMETVRQSLERYPIVGKKFVVDKEAGFEGIVYPQDTTQTGPYFAGEMGLDFKLPPIETEVPVLYG